VHRELLRLAAVLAADTGGLPRWVARNRAVSTAYYALFHALAEFCARELVGAWTPWPPFRHIYRSVEHGHARRVFEEIAKDRTFSQEARVLGQLFVDLQKARHAADYDPGYRVSGPELADILARAQRGIDLIGQLAPGERKLLAARSIGRTRS
jgi:hypothetical protein